MSVLWYFLTTQFKHYDEPSEDEEFWFHITLSICMYINVKGDKLLLDFSLKFWRQFIISHLKLQDCYGNVPCFSVARWRQGFWEVMNEGVRTLKDGRHRKQTHEETQYLRARRSFCKIQRILNLNQNLYSKLLST